MRFLCRFVERVATAFIAALLVGTVEAPITIVGIPSSSVLISPSFCFF